jgi:hypothetical protein
VTAEVSEGQADDLPKVNDQGLTVVLRMRRGGQQVETLATPLSCLFPSALLGEIRADDLELAEGMDRTKGHELNLAVFKVTALGDYDEVRTRHRNLLGA